MRYFCLSLPPMTTTVCNRNCIGVMCEVLPFNEWPCFQDNLGKPAPGLNEAEMMGWQWHQLKHMENICTSLQTGNHV